MHAPITPTSIVRASPDQVSTALDGDAAVLHLGTGLYFGLDAVGAAVWARLDPAIRVADLLADLSDGWEVAPERLQADVLTFLEELRRHGLIEVDG